MVFVSTICIYTWRYNNGFNPMRSKVVSQRFNICFRSAYWIWSIGEWQVHHFQHDRSSTTSTYRAQG